MNINFFSFEENDFISLTDIVRYKNKETTGLVISHWLTTKYTVEFMGLLEQVHNPNFKMLLNSVTLKMNLARMGMFYLLNSGYLTQGQLA